MRLKKAALAGAASLLPLFAALPVHAQEQRSAQESETYRLDIPAQSLATSLMAVAEKTGVNVIFDSKEIAAVRAPALAGRMTAEEAIRKLVAPSRLPVRRTGGGVFVIGGSAASQALSAQVSGERGAIDGRLTQETGRSFAGALVKLVETGEQTRADEDGNFRFNSVAPGDYTLEISYIGFPTVREDVTVTAGSATPMLVQYGSDDEILVFGSRSARATALNMQRTAENNADIIAADDLGNFTGTTFSEALRRAPGIAFQRDPVTGDGTNVIVRGLEPDMNAIKLNGLNLPVGNGLGRSADLSNLLADSVGRITINKSLLPSQDSSGTGGLIEIETLSPLDRPHRYASAMVEGGFTPKDFADDFLASGTVSGTFGSDRSFGLSASVQYRKHSNRSIGYDIASNGGRLAFGRYLPLDEDGQPITEFEAVDPLLNFPFSADADSAYPNGLVTKFFHVQTENLAATVSGEWQIGSHTNLKVNVQHSEAKTSTFSLSDTFSTGADYTVISGGQPNAELSLDLTPGNEGIHRAQDYSYDRAVRKITDTYSLEGRTELGKFELKYLAGYAHGTEKHPRTFQQQLRMPDSDASADLFLPEAVDPATGRIVTGFAPRSSSGIQLPLLSDAGWALVNDPGAFVIDNATGLVDESTGSNNRYTASGSVRWNAERGIFSYLEVGSFYERARFRDYHTRAQIGGGIPVSALGLQFNPSDLTRIGIDAPGFAVLDEQAIREFSMNLDQLVAGTSGLTLTPIEPNPDQDKENTLEETLAAYVQARIDIGKLEIIGGVRYNRTKLSATNLSFPVYTGPILPENGGGMGVDFVFQNQFTQLVTDRAESEDFLPRVLFNYRANDNLIFRGGYFLSVARPSVGQLSDQTRISFINFPIPGPEGVKPILQINSGNPNLKPAKTHNFDISAEYYAGVGVFKLGAFYKRIENLLQTNITNGPATLASVTLPDHPYFNGAPYFDPADPSSVFITGGSPVNSDETAEIWGIEAQAEQRFDFLPGIWSGFGVYANYTYTHSSRVDRYNWAYDPDPDHVYVFTDLPFVQQPKHSGTAALTYTKYDIDATLAYGFQSRALSSFAPRGLSAYTESVKTLDFRASYYLRPDFADIRLFVEASNLLKGTGDPDAEISYGGENGTPKYYGSATYLGGRSFKAGIAVTF